MKETKKNNMSFGFRFKEMRKTRFSVYFKDFRRILEIAGFDQNLKQIEEFENTPHICHNGDFY